MSKWLQVQFHSLTAKTIAWQLVLPEMFPFPKTKMKDYPQANMIWVPKEFPVRL